MPGRVVKVGLIQAAALASKADNIRNAVSRIEEAARRGAELICMQELFATRYFCQEQDPKYFELAEALEGSTLKAIADAAQKAGVSIVTSLFERRAAGLYHNSAVVLGPDGSALGVYRKMHIPNDPQFEEKYYFTPGDLGFVAVETPSLTVGPLICWDQWYPEAARLTALAGAELIAYPTAIGWLPSEKDQLGAAQLAAWQTIQRSHAIANGVFVVAVNRVGFEPTARGGIEFWGHSFVCDPSGVVLAEAGLGEEVLVVECDLDKIEAQRRDWPFLRDRRVDAYSGISKRYRDE